MKILYFIILLMVNFNSVFSQDILPNISLKDIEGKVVNISEIDSDQGPVIINFWATWCAPCKRELNSINEVYQDWVKETGVKLYSISIDDQRTVDRVKPYVLANDWQFEVLLDTNGDLKRAMSVNNVPFTFVIYKNRVVWSHNNYNPGDEEELYLKLKEIKK